MKGIALGVYLSFLLFNCTSPTKESSAVPYYLNHKLDTPAVFLNGAITTMNGINFSSDGKILYLSQQVERKFDNGKHYAAIFESHYENGAWTTPEETDLGLPLDSYHPVLSVDNGQLFFNSRSHPDSANRSVAHNIWVVSKTSNGWSKPTMVQGINSMDYDSYPSPARNRNLYFNSNRAGGQGGMDIYVSYFIDGQYQTPLNIKTINSRDEENDLVVDPDERFIIFNRYFHDSKALDLFISFKKNNEWGVPENLKRINQVDRWELTPTLSPDGKYFFYELDGKIMQIDLKAALYPIRVDLE